MNLLGNFKILAVAQALLIAGTVSLSHLTGIWFVLALIAVVMLAAWTVFATLAGRARFGNMDRIARYYTQALNTNGLPVCRSLGMLAMSEPSDSKVHLKSLQHRILTAAARSSGKQSRNNRASIYVFDDTRGALSLAEQEGREENAIRSAISPADTEPDRQMIEFARSSRKAHIGRQRDGDDEYAGIDPSDRSFTSFVIVPIFAGNEHFGLLIVDSPRSDNFTLGGDDGLLLMTAQIMAVGMAMARRSVAV
ncbi:hypothetical protein [Rhizocola hellebori]|uniref:hypothetical protein n=1 Tax=Rhizocola hellebori TaxID=1392758 RepID=UPI001940F814|nr:hypothetical protein [Rhizocola hellebori]